MLPWQKPWKPSSVVSDYNLFTMADKANEPRTYYKGMNGIICELTRIMEFGSDDPRWCTIKQLQAYNRGLENKEDHIFVRKGEHGLPIKYYSKLYFDSEGKLLDSENGTPENFSFYKPVLKSYTIFNASQIVKFMYDRNGKKLLDQNGNFVSKPAFIYDRGNSDQQVFTPYIEPDRIIRNTGAVIVHDTSDLCAYIPTQDKIHMVKPDNFKNPEEYYDTLLHELTHWTGHPDRLNRESARRYRESVEWKAREELVAEIGGYLLAKECNIAFNPSQNNIAYVNSWMKDLKNDPQSIFKACHQADRAQKYILDFSRNREKAQDLKRVYTNENDRGYSR